MEGRSANYGSNHISREGVHHIARQLSTTLMTLTPNVSAGSRAIDASTPPHTVLAGGWM